MLSGYTLEYISFYQFNLDAQSRILFYRSKFFPLCREIVFHYFFLFYLRCVLLSGILLQISYSICAAITKFHRLDGFFINNRNSFSQFWRLRSPRSKQVLAVSMSLENLFPSLWMSIFHCALT